MKQDMYLELNPGLPWQNRILFTNKLDLRLRTKPVKLYVWSIALCLDTSANRSEIPERFWNVVLEKDEIDQLDRSCEEWRSVT